MVDSDDEKNNGGARFQIEKLEKNIVKNETKKIDSHKRVKRKSSSHHKRSSFESVNSKRSSFESAHSRRSSFESVNSARSKQKKRRDSASSIGSSGFLNRLDISLVKNVDYSIDESQEFQMIDVEENIELNRQKEKNREKMKKRKNKRDGVDPRLFPSYYDSAENTIDDDDDELSMEDFVRSSYSSRRSRTDNNSNRSNRMMNASIRSTYSSRRSMTDNNSNRSNRMVSAVQGRKIVQLSVILPHVEVKSRNGKGKKVDFSKMLADSQREGVIHGIRPHKDMTSFSAPIRLLEIENGRAILVKGTGDKIRKSRITMSVAAVKQTLAPEDTDAVFLGARDVGKGNSLRKKISDGDVRDFKVAKPERGITARQDNLRRLLVWSLDDVNALNFGRQVQLSIPFLTGYESYLLGQVVEVLDSLVSNSGLSKNTRRQVRRKTKTELNEILRFAFKNHNVSRVITENIGHRWNFSWHWFQQLCKCCRYDAWGQLPIVGITESSTTENFPTPGDWIKTFWTPDPDKIMVQNVSADYNGFEARKRIQLGTYIDRLKTNDFRIANRLPVDESIVHTFVVSPMSTMINNGAVHVLRVIAKHWSNILAQPFGNFAHHRLEQINPFETMRFHMPNVCIVLASLRGRNIWDARVLGPFIHKCQILTTSFTANECRNLAKEMLSNIVPELCAGVIAIEKPLSQWLEAIQDSCHVIEEEAKEIYKEVTGVEIGLQFGYDLITQVSWKIPSGKELEKAILLYLRGKYPGEIVQERNIRKALLSTTPRDKRTLLDLVKLNLHTSKPAKVLVKRVKDFLKRDIRREFLNDAIRELSTGETVVEDDYRIGDWYWLNEENDKKSVHIFKEEVRREDDNLVYRFVRADSGVDRIVTFDELEATKCRRYIPVAESIVRAQRCYMNLELEYCHKFKYTAFVEFAFLRTALNRLAVISQIFCEELDNARLNILQEVKASNQVRVEAGDLQPGNTYYIHNRLYDVYAPFVCKKKYVPSDPEWEKLEKVEMVNIPPQSTIVVGSGITRLLTVIHCTESVLASGGDMKLYETCDANTKGGSIFERAQIVRLDSCWVAMLRYHLGTSFEETFIPTSIELHAQLGNNLVTQGFVEITIKDLECILHTEITKLMSKELIQVSTGSKIYYDAASNSMIKLGEHLELGDKVLRRVNPMGKPCKELHRWTIADVQNADALGVGDLCIGEDYDMYDEQEDSVLTFKLTGVNLETRTYKFESMKKKINDIEATAHDLPSFFPKGSKRHFKTVLIRCETKGDSETSYCDHLSQKLKGVKFVIDIGHNHVVECIGKPVTSPYHFQVTSSEPYGFCCISRLNRSMGGRGVLDGFHSIDEKNTRISGDSIKIVRQTFIAEEMVTLIYTENWQRHFIKLIEDSNFPSLNDKDPIVTKLMEAVESHNHHAGNFRRQTLQIKISETTDNFYLGMELTREYEKWKIETVDQILFPIEQEKKAREDNEVNVMSIRKKRNIEELKETLRYNIDLLWFEACVQVVRHRGVYNNGRMHVTPRLHLINSNIGEDLKHLSVGDTFRVSSRMNRKFEILVANKKEIFTRNADGIVQKFEPATEVFREGCLPRSIDGNSESKVAIASFHVSQCVNHRSVYLNNESKGYVFASIGDEQSTSHFMHYSALSGGCINTMQFNQFLRSAIYGVSFIDRLRLYSKETNWSNGELIKRGIMNSFGQDAFLRPGFSYKQGLKYIRSQVIGGKQNLDNVMSHDWKTTFAASMIPRGMELNNKFIKTLKAGTNHIIFDLFLEGAMNDETISWSDELEKTLKTRRDDILSLRNRKDHYTFWEQFLGGLRTSLDDASQKRLQDFHGEVGKETEQCISEIIDLAKESHLFDQRSSQELWNQPKPVDSIVDAFTTEARNLPNSLAQLTVFCAAAVALALYASRQDSFVYIFEICSVSLSVVNMFLSFGTLLNSRKYKNRNGQARAIFFNNHFSNLKNAVYSAMDVEDRKVFFEGTNPFLEELEEKKEMFVKDIAYYGLEDPDELIYDYRRLLERSDQPAAFKHFQKAISTYYIPDVYQINSYVQQSLVDVYKVCDKIHTLLTPDEHRSSREGGEMVPHLFARVSRFGPRLQKSIGSRLMNSEIFLALRYFWSLICCSSSIRVGRITSIENETYGIIEETKLVSKAHNGSILKRQIHDLEYLYRATLETDRSSVIFLCSSLVFIASWIFAISRIVKGINGTYSVLTVVGIWSQLMVIFAALLSLLYFVRNFRHSIWLFAKLGFEIRAKKTDESTRNGVRKIKGFVFMQLLLTTIRVCTVLCSIIALSWCVVGNAFPEQIWISESSAPLYIALVAFCLVIGTMILCFFVEYINGYNLPPKLGEVICETFREEIESMYETLSIPENNIDTKQYEERITWEYVAREFLHKYRFDAVFGPDRFGSILQYLQYGMQNREGREKDGQC